jgi:hypothetical protein
MRVYRRFFVATSSGAATSEPKEFADHSINTIEEFAEYDRNRHLRDARRHASPAQKKAIKELT